MKQALKRVVESYAPRLLYRAHILRSRLSKDSEPELRFLSRLCRRDAISVDVGANVGVYTLEMKKHSSHVVCFEPMECYLARLRVLFRDSITLHEVALSDHSGKAELRVPHTILASPTIEKQDPLQHSMDSADSYVIEVRTLDSFNLRGVGFIKIDVEGHEYAVLCGARETISREKPSLLIEIEERHSPGVFDRVFPMLTDLGYHGRFYDAGRFRSISEFNIERDQPLSALTDKGKSGRYINNFIFEC